MLKCGCKAHTCENKEDPDESKERNRYGEDSSGTMVFICHTCFRNRTAERIEGRCYESWVNNGYAQRLTRKKIVKTS